MRITRKLSLHTLSNLQKNSVLLTTKICLNKSSSGDEIPERDVTYHLICLLIFIYH